MEKGSLRIVNDLFVDTSGWAELFMPSHFHKLCAELYAASVARNKKLITTKYVITEIVSLFENRFRVPRETLVQTINEIYASRSIEVIHIDLETHRKAWRLLSTCLDKDWTLVDCSSFIVMKERGITDALTTDHHFEQAGFTVLLK